MNLYTKEIAVLLKTDLDTALKVQDYIDENWLLDWSECSQKQFDKVVKSVAKELKVA